MSDIVQAAGSTPPLRDFLVSPGFAGLALVIAAVALFFAVLYSSRRAEKRLDRQLDQSDIHQQERRADRDRDAAIKRGWERLQWLIDTATNEPAGIANGEVVTLGLGPELTLTILSGLQREATELGDDALASAAAVYLSQYGKVLAQLGGVLPNGRTPNGHQDSPAEATPAPATAGAKEAETSAAPATPATPEKGRRR